MSKDKFKEMIIVFEGYAGKLNNSINISNLAKLKLIDLKKKNSKLIINGKSNKYGLYYDSEGKLTTGYGHLVLTKKNINEFVNMTEDQANAQLDKNIKKHDKELNKLLRIKGIKKEALDKDKYNSLRSMVFNLGSKKLSRYTNMFKALKSATTTNDLFEKEKHFAKAGVEILASKSNTPSLRFTQIGNRAVLESNVFFTDKNLKKYNKDKKNYNEVLQDRLQKFKVYDRKRAKVKDLNKVLDSALELKKEKPIDRQQEKIDNIMLNISPEDTVRFGRQPGRLYAKVQERNDEEIVGKEIKREQETEGNQQTTQRIS